MILQLFNALLLCVTIVLESGKIDNLVEHFKNNCAAVNPKLRQLIGQVCILLLIPILCSNNDLYES